MVEEIMEEDLLEDTITEVTPLNEMGTRETLLGKASLEVVLLMAVPQEGDPLMMMTQTMRMKKALKVMREFLPNYLRGFTPGNTRYMDFMQNRYAQHIWEQVSIQTGQVGPEVQAMNPPYPGNEAVQYQDVGTNIWSTVNFQGAVMPENFSQRMVNTMEVNLGTKEEHLKWNGMQKGFRAPTDSQSEAQWPKRKVTPKRVERCQLTEMHQSHGGSDRGQQGLTGDWVGLCCEGVKVSREVQGRVEEGQNLGMAGLCQSPNRSHKDWTQVPDADLEVHTSNSEGTEQAKEAKKSRHKAVRKERWAKAH
ncbi:hypothetical protein EDD17DRAFT_1503368 [Pisolithus thermaeus]|nr:hypothetical protein EDD17DRAFT_1503368 [Pisolithus thermaeus]